MTRINEFMTGWDPAFAGFKPHIWADRDEQGLMKVARSSRGMPNIRPFDMVAAPNEQVLLMANDDQRIGVESVVGAQERFVRNVDFDLLLLQFAGTSSVETEFGTCDMAPGELILIPGGIAHRSTGSADCLRLWVGLNTPVTEFYGEESHRGLTEFSVRRVGGPDWTVPDGAREAPKGRVIENMVTWHDGPDDFTEVERDWDDLVGSATIRRGAQESGIRKIRIFDVFWELTGAGKGPGPKVVGSPNFMLEVYNTRGSQHAFHRALRTEEFGVQFRGAAENISELEGTAPVKPGDMYLVPRGIAHRIRALDDEFLRFVLYSDRPWRIMVDPTTHAFDSSFEIDTRIVRPAAWMTEAAE